MSLNASYEDKYRKVHNKKKIKKLRPEGASRWMSGKLLLRLSVVIPILAFAGLVAYASLTGPFFRLANITIEGGSHSDVAWLERVIRSEFSPNLLRLEIGKVREIAESMPWVKRAEVRRMLPDSLRITLVEREPVALAKIEQDLILVDAEGRFLQRCQAGAGQYDLPVVRGLNNTEQENFATENARKMAVLLNLLQELDAGGVKNSASVSEIDVSDERHVAVIPMREAIPVYLGEGGYLRKYEIYLSKLSLLDRLKQQYGPIVSIDFSVDDKIIYHHRGKEAAEKAPGSES